MNPDLTQSATDRAWNEAKKASGHTPVRVIMTLVAALAAVTVTGWLPDSWTESDEELLLVAVRAVSAAAGFLSPLVLLFVFHLALAPVRQRDEARSLLSGIKEAANTYDLKPIQADVEHMADSRWMVRLHFRNLGRWGQFAAVLDHLDGIQGYLVDPATYLYWCGRPGVVAEEIPPGEPRQIGILQLTRGSGQRGDEPFTLQVFGVDSKPHSRVYSPEDAKVDISLSVALRGESNLSVKLLVHLEAWFDSELGDAGEFDVRVVSHRMEREVYAPGFDSLIEGIRDQSAS